MRQQLEGAGGPARGLAHPEAVGGSQLMPTGPTAALPTLDGSLEVLQGVEEARAGAMPKVGLDTPLNGPKKEKWWYEVRAQPFILRHATPTERGLGRSDQPARGGRKTRSKVYSGWAGGERSLTQKTAAVVDCSAG